MRPKYESFHPRQGNLDESIDRCQSQCFLIAFLKFLSERGWDQELCSGTRPPEGPDGIKSDRDKIQGEQGFTHREFGGVLIRSVPNPTASRLAVNAMDSH